MITIEMIPRKPMFKIRDVASLFSVSGRTVYGWITYGKIDSIKIAGIVRIPYESIVEFINVKGKPIKNNKLITQAKIRQALSSRLRSAVKGKIKKTDLTMNILGCSIEHFLKHIEKQFIPGMTWDNYGRNGWHLDHIIPCKQFDLTRPYHQKICFHYTNLQPMWERDNIVKSDTISRIAVAKYFINHRAA